MALRPFTFQERSLRIGMGIRLEYMICSHLINALRSASLRPNPVKYSFLAILSLMFISGLALPMILPGFSLSQSKCQALKPNLGNVAGEYLFLFYGAFLPGLEQEHDNMRAAGLFGAKFKDLFAGHTDHSRLSTAGLLG